MVVKMSLGTVPLWSLEELYDNMPVSLWAGIPESRRKDALLVVGLAQALRPDLNLYYGMNSYVRRAISSAAEYDLLRQITANIGQATFGRLEGDLPMGFANLRTQAALLVAIARAANDVSILPSKYLTRTAETQQIDGAMVLGGYKISTADPNHVLYGCHAEFLIQPLCESLGHPWFITCPACPTTPAS